MQEALLTMRVMVVMMTLMTAPWLSSILLSSLCPLCLLLDKDVAVAGPQVAFCQPLERAGILSFDIASEKYYFFYYYYNYSYYCNYCYNCSKLHSFNPLH